jgi:hypothetical protein
VSFVSYVGCFQHERMGPEQFDRIMDDNWFILFRGFDDGPFVRNVSSIGKALLLLSATYYIIGGAPVCLG